MDKKVIIFDLDGTLLNTLEDLTDSTNFALESFGYEKRSIDEVRNFVGNGVAKLIERAIPDGVGNKDYEGCLRVFKEHYSKNMYNKTAPYPGIIDMLKTLRQKGYGVAVVSNKFDIAVRALCDKYFSDLIDGAAGENEIAGIKKKPAPDSVYAVVARLGADLVNCIYVGDSEVDIMTAQNSGIPCVSVLWGFKDREFLIAHGAQIIVQTPDEIIKYLAG